jgi:lipoate-protein ligase A
MGKAEYKVVGGKLIKVQLTRRDDKIQRIKIMGDFFLHPEELIEDLEASLTGQQLNESTLANGIKAFMEKKGAALLGASPEDFAKCIAMAGMADD